MNIDKMELAWAAGFFDGEGCLSGAQWPKLTVVQTDRRPLERFQARLHGISQTMVSQINLDKRWVA